MAVYLETPPLQFLPPETYKVDVLNHYIHDLNHQRSVSTELGGSIDIDQAATLVVTSFPVFVCDNHIEYSRIRPFHPF